MAGNGQKKSSITCITQRPEGRQRNKHNPEHALKRRKLRAQRPMRSTLWSTKSCTLDAQRPIGAQFGAQKVARSATHPEHALEHKKLHAQRPIRSTLWSTKSCTLNDLSGARFGAQKVARSTTYPEHALEHKKLHAQRPIWSTLWSTKSCTLNDLSGARFGAQKVARSMTHPEHGNSLECSVVSEAPNNLHTGGFAQVQGHFGGCFFSCLFLFVELKILKSIPE